MNRFILLLGFFLFLNCGEQDKNPVLKDAEQAFVLGDLKKADLKISELLKEEPNHQNALFLRTKVLFYTGRIQEAKKILDTLDNDVLSKTEAILLFSRINLALNQKSAESIVKLTSVIEDQPLNLDALLIRGKLYELSGKIPEAIRDYQKIIQQTEKIRMAHLSIANVYSNANAKDKANFHIEHANKLIISNKKGNQSE